MVTRLTFTTKGLAAAVGALLTTQLMVAPAMPKAHHSEFTSKAEVQKHLKEIEAKRKENAEKLRQAKKQERIALAQLHKINANLNVTNKALKQNKNKLQQTETTIKTVETTITQTETKEQCLSTAAVRRLRDMYEGQRLGLLEMLFTASSLQQVMDLLYFQERIAEMDKKLIDELRLRERALAAQKNQLGSQKLKLGDVISEFAKKALMLNKEKSEQEQVADKLRTQRDFYEAAEGQLQRESGQLEQQIIQMMNAANHSTDNKSMAKGSGTMAMPIHASVTSPFGWRRHPIFGRRKFHTGVDLGGPNHAAIKAADSGNVLYSGWYGGYGRVVIVSHGNGLATLYAHLSKPAVTAGQNVQKGDTIGYEGSTGFSTGPHLHFEVRVDGKPNNPLNYVR